MSRKKYDIAVKTGEYIDSQGQKKGRWQNVGAVLEGQDGRPFLMLAKWFNPAGVPEFGDRVNDRDTVLLALFEPRQQGGGQQSSGGGQRPPATSGQQSGVSWAPPAGLDDEIPF